MRAPPESLDERGVVDALRDGWDFAVRTAVYVPLGGGSYHWEVTDETGGRCFATVDDLTRKAWLGPAGDLAFAGLQRAFDTALALRRAGLQFVVAPLPACDGSSLRRLDSRYAISLFPFLNGEAGQFGRYEDDDHRRAVIAMLAELHSATAASVSARTAGFELPGRELLEAALRELDEAWTGGPLSEPAREAVITAASGLTELLALADRLSATAQEHAGEWVVTHGEPHAGNIVRTSEGWRFVDWDTVALAPRERDLWMPLRGGHDDVADLYRRLTGQHVNDAALDFFELTWDLKDLAEYLNVLRSTHEENADTVRQYQALVEAPTIRERWTALLD
jgi:hypothetical protein